MIGTSSIGANQVMQSNVRPVNMAPSNISNPQSSYVKPNVGYSQVPNNQVQPNITVSQPTGVQVIQGGQPVQNSFLAQRWYISIWIIIFISNNNELSIKWSLRSNENYIKSAWMQGGKIDKNNEYLL